MGANQSVHDDSDSGSDEEEGTRRGAEEEDEEDEEEDDRGSADGESLEGVNDGEKPHGERRGKLPGGGERGRGLVGQDGRSREVVVACRGLNSESSQSAQPQNHQYFDNAKDLAATGSGGRLGDAWPTHGLNGNDIRETRSARRSAGDPSSTSAAAAGAAGGDDDGAGAGAGGVLLLEQEPEVSPFRQSQLPVEPQHNSPQSSLSDPTPPDMPPSVRLLPPTAAPAAVAAASGSATAAADADAGAGTAVGAALEGFVNRRVVADAATDASSGSRSRTSSGGSTSSSSSSDGFGGKLGGESSDGADSRSSVSLSPSGVDGAGFATSRSLASSLGSPEELSLSHMLKPSPAVVDALAALEGEGEEKRGRTGEKEQWSLAAEVLVNPASNGVIVATVGAGAAVEETGSAGSALAAGGEDPAAMDGTTTAAATAAGSSGGRLANGEKQEEGSGQAGAAAAAGEASQAWQGLMDAQVDVMSVSRPLSSHPFLHATFTPSDYSTEFYIIRHGEAAHNVSLLIGGRSHDAPLTALGQQQAKLLGAYLREYAGLRFDAIFSSPIERSKQTAILVCQEIGEVESRIQYSDELQELSQGTWERQPRRTIYQQGVLEQMTAAQPDFRAPGGESQRQVEFRMVEFINSVLFARQHLISPGPAALAAAHCLGLHTSHSAPSLHHLASPPPPAASSSSSSSSPASASFPSASSTSSSASHSSVMPSASAPFSSTSFSSSSSSAGATPAKDRPPRAPVGAAGAGTATAAAAVAAVTGGGGASGGVGLPGGDGGSSGTSGDDGITSASSVSGTGSHSKGGSVFRVAVFSHGTAIRCLLRGLLGSNPHLTQNIGIDNTSITLLKHTPKKGWHLVKTNDTAHLIIAKGPLSAQQAC